MNLNMNIANPEVMEELTCGSNVLSEQEYRDIVIAISEFACGVVSKTLGPYGKTTNVDDSTFTAPTKDGWTVLRSLRFNDPLYNSIYNVINQISFDLVTKVGDGTTSALTGANIFMHAILDKLKKEDSPLFNVRQQDLLNDIEEIKNDIVERLSASSEIRRIRDDNEYEDIYKLAKVSSNGNEDLSRIIQEIYQQTQNPNIYVTLDSGDKLTYEIQEGYKLDGMVINQKLYRNAEDGYYHIDTPIFVAVFDHNVTYNEHKHVISALSRYASSHNTSVLIMAPYFDDIIMNILNTTIQSFVQKNQIPNLIMMQVPLAMTADRLDLSDFVLLTNGIIFDYGKVRALNVTLYNADPKNAKNKIEDDLLDIEQYHFNSVDEMIDTCVGKINRAIFAEKYVVISHYDTICNKELYENTVKEIETEFKEIARRTNKSSNILSKDYMLAQQRYIKMLGKMGSIKVGGQTELAKHCLKDSVDDAVLACRSAYNNGYIRGLNLTTLNTIHQMILDSEEDLESEKEHYLYSPTQREILRMFYQVFYEMSRMVLCNKYPDYADGTESSYLVSYPIDNQFANQLKESKTMTNTEVLDFCIRSGDTFDLITNTVEHEWTVVNSLSTDVEILNSVVGVLSILLTSDQFVSLNKSYDRKISRKIGLERKSEEAKAEETGRLQARLDFINQFDINLSEREKMAYALGESAAFIG